MSRKNAKSESLRGLILQVLFVVYRKVLSPFLHAASGTACACRFQPSCSEYSQIAMEHHGFVRGGLLAIGRIAKCHPLHPGGFDPVPGTWTLSPNPATTTPVAPSMQSSAPPVTIVEAEFRAIPAAALRPMAATLPYDRR